LNLVGGCCGTTPAHVAALALRVAGRTPRRVAEHSRCFVSGIEAVELTDDNRPLLVGERTNVLGSRRFRRFVEQGEWERAAEVGRGQVRGGAQVLDVCLQDPDRDELRDVESFLDRLTRLVKVPLMVDSTDADVMARALTWCQGRSILNSVNLEDGRGRLDRVAGLARQFGAALVVGAIDEQGMAVTPERKLEVAARCFEILVGEQGLRPEDLWWDPLVFPCGTGDPNYLGSARATLEAVTRLKEAFPGSRTILGISNVSFGLPAAGREVLNSVFLYHATRAGLDAAIVNTEGIARYAEIPAGEKALAERFLTVGPGDAAATEQAVAEFTAHFRHRDPAASRKPRRDLPLEERLARSIVEGSKEGLETDLEAALADPRWPEPLDVINGPLMAGMEEVGRLFNDNQLIVAEVLQSAEVMKAAVSFLERHMEGGDRAGGRGTVLLATVKGDVHDIGKNLVEIILANNGFRVINLGIKVPSERLVDATAEHRPHVIGLSGLLVKSAQQMVLTAGDLAAAGIDVPLLVGGAALTRRFTHRKIAAAYGGLCTYAKDAMHGLELVERLTDPARRSRLEAEVGDAIAGDVEPTPDAPAEDRPGCRVPERSVVRRDVVAPPPPDLERHLAVLDLDEVWSHLNRQMLFSKYFGLKGVIRKREAQGDEQFRKVAGLIEEVQTLGRRNGLLETRAIWRFFPALADGERLRLLDPESGDMAAEWTFPRQVGRESLALPDYVVGDDHVALFVTTAGRGVREQAERWKEEGEYLKCHALAALALETAEAAAEWLHMRLRAVWGFPDPAETSPEQRFAARYRGRRYSFGYPACPDLEGQRALFAALRPEDIGVDLTEGDMMEPEASVSALVFHHPDAKYFAV
jgi:5-methyltetrahydrofolate--homocysteine methyltransferase